MRESPKQPADDKDSLDLGPPGAIMLPAGYKVGNLPIPAGSLLFVRPKKINGLPTIPSTTIQFPDGMIVFHDPAAIEDLTERIDLQYRAKQEAEREIAAGVPFYRRAAIRENLLPILVFIGVMGAGVATCANSDQPAPENSVVQASDQNKSSGK